MIKRILVLLMATACPVAAFASGGAVRPVGSPALPDTKLVHPDATTTVSLNTHFFDFGDNLVGNPVVKTAVLVKNTGAAALTLGPALTGDASYSIVAAGSCGATLAAGTSCDVMVQYLPTTASNASGQNAILNLHLGNVPAGTLGSVAITGASGKLSAGVIANTLNPQVALYTMTLPFPGKMRVKFGLTTNYGFQTWWQSTDDNNGTIGMFVAGMKATTTYHMVATVELANGITVTDTDHTFTTGAIPTALQFPLLINNYKGMTPQPGVEMINPLKALAVVDLAGNSLWSYAAPTPTLGYIDGVKFLPDGNFLMTIGAISSFSLGGPIPTAMVNEIREVNLAGETVKEISITDLNAELATATCKECNVVLETFHHDVEPLPNGHWLVLSNTMLKLSPTTTPPLTNKPAGEVLGDVIVDLDENLQPVWAWNEFNHLNVNRIPYGSQWPDWTHSNALIYSPDDGQLIVSVRHQNWVMKVNYKNGTGDGSIQWKLGEGGTLKLVGGVDPTDWQYAQHGPDFFSSNTSGVFELGLMDNGDDRIFPSPKPQANCAPNTGAVGTCYSTIPIFKIDETAKTATLVFHQIIDHTMYSYFGGQTHSLPNGNVEYDLAGVGTSSSDVWEVTNSATPQNVWHMHSADTALYRASRIPSLYPGVTW